MSKEKVKLPSDGSVEAALEAFRGEREDVQEKYLVLGYSDKTTLCVVAQGEGGLAEATPFVSDKDQTYILLRKVHIYEISTTIKFAYIDYTPSTASPMRKALLSTHKGQVEDILKPFHVSLQADCVEELDESVILDKIGFSSGTKNNVKTDLTYEQKQALSVTRERKEVKKTHTKGLVPSSVQKDRAVVIEGEDDLKQGIDAVRQDSSDIDWVLAKYKDDQETIMFVGTGTGGINELATNLNDDTVHFAFFRTEEKFDDTVTIKFSFVRLLSSRVPPLKRARQSTHFGFITSIFEPFHVEFVIDDKSELTEQMVSERIQSVMGVKDRVLADDDARAAPQKKAVEKKVNHVPVKGTADQIKFVDGDAVVDAIKAVRDDSDATTWMSAKYAGKHSLQLNGSGEGDVDALLSSMDSSTVNFGLLRVTDQIDKSTTVKFVYVKYQPENVPPMKKAEISTKKGLIDDIFSPFHVDFFINSPNELNQSIVTDKVSTTSGSKSKVVPKTD